MRESNSQQSAKKTGPGLIEKVTPFFKKKWVKWPVVALLIYFVALPIFWSKVALPIGRKFNDHFDKVEAEQLAMKETRSRQLAQIRLAEAERLSKGVLIPANDSDTAFVYTTTKNDRTVFVVKKGYCSNAEPVDERESYVFSSQSEVILVGPTSGRSLKRAVEYFSLKAYGSDSVNVRISVYKSESPRECKPPKRQGA